MCYSLKKEDYMYKVLFVNDGVEPYKLVNEYNVLNKLYYHIQEISSNVDVSEHLSDHSFALILISCTLTNPIKMGVDFVKEFKLNEASKSIPLILCTKKDTIPDHISFLDCGADDVFKTSNGIELLFSKMNAILRKTDKDRNDHVSVLKKFYFMDDSLEVDFHGHRHKLTCKEFKLLKTFAENPGKVFSQDELNRITSGSEVFISKRCIDTFITRIRNKIGKDSIISVRKKGYKLNDCFLDISEHTFTPDPIES